jgi:hypothetical protein
MRVGASWLHSFYRLSSDPLAAENRPQLELGRLRDRQIVQKETVEIDLEEIDRTNISSRSIQNNLMKRSIRNLVKTAHFCQ